MIKLTPDDVFQHSSYKLQVRDIFAMYNHEWDVIGEVLQNAVDAVMKRREHQDADSNYQPKIYIEYNLQRNFISVRDNGDGIDSSAVQKVVAPHFSAKNPKGTNRGEFGVGLAYVAFYSNEFRLESKTASEHTFISMKNGYFWATDIEDEEHITIEFQSDENKAEDESGTHIIFEPVRFPEFTQQKLVYCLQRFTAVGDFWSAFDDENGDIEIKLKYVAKDGVETELQLENRLWHPADYFNLIGRETVDYYKIKNIDEGPRNEAIPNMIGMGMVRKDKITHKGREYAIYALLCFGEIYRDLAKEIGVMGELSEEEEYELEEQEDQDEGETIQYIQPEIDLYPGIFACKKGMPLGADIPRPARSGTGYWSGFYIVVHSDTLSTEPGRKKLNITDERLVQSIARKVFRDMQKLSAYVISRNVDIQQEAILRKLEQNRREMREWINTNPLQSEEVGVQVLVEPKNEQTLIGLFHELIAAKRLLGYRLVKLSSTDTYDGLYNYEIASSEIGRRAFEQWLQTLSANERRKYKNEGRLFEELIVVEFKLDLFKIIRDFLSKQKYHPSIKLLVAWDADENKIEKRGWHLQKLPPVEVRYFGANYTLRPSSEGQSKGIMSTPVLLIRRFIDDYIYKKNNP
ncbi:MAG: ATP-binding protein [Chloroflexota bacterium]